VRRLDGSRKEAVVVIASRTPEGIPNHCPVCGYDLKLEPSRPALDAPCPHCGHLVWFLQEAPTSQQRLIQCVLHIVTARFGPINSETRAVIEDTVAKEPVKELLEKAMRCRSIKELVSPVTVE
jgi:hypothetical protein